MFCPFESNYQRFTYTGGWSPNPFLGPRVHDSNFPVFFYRSPVLKCEARKCRQLYERLMNYIMHKIAAVLHKSRAWGQWRVHGGRVTMIHGWMKAVNGRRGVYLNLLLLQTLKQQQLLGKKMVWPFSSSNLQAEEPEQERSGYFFVFFFFFFSSGYSFYSSSVS